MKKLKLIRFIVITLIANLLSGSIAAQYGSYDVLSLNGKYTFSYVQNPDNLVPVNATNTGTAYSWEMCLASTFDAGTVTVAGSSATYTFSSPLTQTTYFRRKITVSGITYTSNVLKIEVVSKNWEDINYIREHDVLISGLTDWKAVDQLAIGQKLQVTTYFDGLGRPIQNVNKGAATPAAAGGEWGDIVQFHQYDIYGREVKKNLPYTTVNQAGKYKTNTVTDQSAYYANAATYNETSPFSNVTFENSPLNRALNVKEPGTSWAASAGVSMSYDLNDATDNVQQFTIGYTSGSLPLVTTPYAANTLQKFKSTDENGKQVIKYMNSQGQLVLSKTQLADNPADAHNGWICVYYIYDDLGRLRFEIQPEAVKWLLNHSWSFAVSGGQGVADELCFRYEYDDKGRTILKKAPGAKPLQMIYDTRDRLVLAQDGNQASKTTPEWTANLYDDLDRPIITTLYNSSLTVSQLRTNVNNATTTTTVTVNNPAQPVNDLVVDSREITVTRYAARSSIEFYPGFVSAAGDNFTAEIDPTVQQTINVTTVTNKSVITQTDLNNSSVCTVLKYSFYDDYNFTAVKSFDNVFDNASAYPSGGDVLPVATTKRVTGFATGSLVRVLGSNTFLASTIYFDEKGNLIQIIEDNIKSGKDVTTLQYHWDGRLLSSHTKHTTASSGYSSFGILAKNIFDNIGRLVSLQKKYGSNAFKTIATYDLDDFGRLRTKHLDPDYVSPNGGLENLDYSYNIHGNITGINKDYALKTAGKYDKWGHFFGLYLGYDNRDGLFNAAKLNDQVTGLEWNTQGDDNQRRYDYTYDNASRLTKADFKEKPLPADAWSNAKMDFGIGGTGTGGTMSYDLNGNLISMLQKGVVPGGTGPVTVDNLSYTYATLSNKLTKVADNGTLGATNGMLGDFKDGANGSDDYVYDDNGNLIVDLNKNALNATGGKTTPLGIAGIIYNYLDKPETIRVSGKGTITIVYDADGNRLQRTYTPDGGTAKTTTYINEFVYEGNDLSFINFEEGRIRVLNAVSTNNGFDGLAIDGNMDLPGTKRGAYDYFIRDYQQNVRMILTEETHYGINQCTMENSRSANEEPYFGQEGPNNEVSKTRFAISGIPGQTTGGGWHSNISGSVSKLGALTQKAGPNVLLKVMAGDQVSATTSYYYQNSVTNSTGDNLTSSVLTALVQSILGSPATGLAKGNSSNISAQLNANTDFLNKTAPDANNSSGNLPKAYLTIIFFNERFEYVKESSTSIRVGAAGDGQAPLVIPNIKAPKNGYAYVYLSNESNEPVYFDDFKVTDTRGRIIEENHYYAYGLKIAGISSRKFDAGVEGSLKNNYQYQGDFSELDEDIGWHDFPLRNYDAQTGRWVQADPFGQFASPYCGMGNDPLNLIDPSGGIGIPCPGTSQLAIFFMKAGEVASKGMNVLSSVSPWLSIGLNAARIGGTVYNNSVQFKAISNQLAGNMTMQVGELDKRAFEHDGRRDGGDPQSGNNDLETKIWDLNRDGKLQKSEADNWYLNGKGSSILVDGNKIDLTGLDAEDMTYNKKKDIYSLATIKAFKVLPLKTSSTYGGSNFKLVNGKWHMLSQAYHYKMRGWNSLENIARNILTIVGDPSRPIRPSQMNSLHGKVSSKGMPYYINIIY